MTPQFLSRTPPAAAYSVPRHGWILALIVRFFLGPTAATGQDPVPGPSSHLLRTAGFDDYRQGTGRLEGGVWKVRLRAEEVQWRPRGEGSPSLTVYAFSAEDGAPRVPAPMIRVPSGTPVEVTVTNGLQRTLVLRGLSDHPEPLPASRDTSGPEPLPPTFREESLRLEPGATGTTRFTPTAEGSFLYYARTLPVYGPIGEEIFGGDGPDGPFVGPLIVDPPGTVPSPRERVMLITRWGDRQADPASWAVSWKMMINGRSWPATERLEYTVGDTVTWRVLNASLNNHPMHLHGFYFRVDARGDPVRDTVYAPSDRRLAVTELVDAVGGTLRLTWVPETAGNWLFHCHLVRHMSPVQRLVGEPAVAHHGAGGTDHAQHGMAGMIMGITVHPRPGEAVHAEVPARQLHLFTGRRSGRLGADPGYGFALQDGDVPPAADSVPIPGSPIILTRGETTEIVVHNRLGFPFGVHWHGLELPSRYDGVSDWSGQPGRTTPAIPSGESLAVRITPKRSGTFMYHVHSEPGHELAQGMYGPFLVLEPGQTYDAEHDRLFVLGSHGTDINAQVPVVNGVSEGAPMEFRSGRTYRLRFMHISSDETKSVRLLNGDQPETWTVVAKDGADLPGSQVRDTPASSRIGVGETFDVVWTPREPGARELVIRTSFYGATGRSPHETRIPVQVR